LIGGRDRLLVVSGKQMLKSSKNFAKLPFGVLGSSLSVTLLCLAELGFKLRDGVTVVR
jgi:hypothetical protein